MRVNGHLRLHMMCVWGGGGNSHFTLQFVQVSLHLKVVSEKVLESTKTFPSS